MEIINYKNNLGFSSEFFILTSEKGTILIDAGFYNEEVKNKLKEIGNVDAILLTHGHWDHIQAIDEIVEDFPNVKVYINKEDYEFLKKPEYNLSFKHRPDLIVKTDAIKLDEGMFKVGDYNIELIHTPGHTGGSSLYYFKDEKVLFTGDTIGPDTIGNSYYPTGTEDDMSKSLNKFKNLNLPNDTICYSSHWGYDTYENLLKYNQYL